PIPISQPNQQAIDHALSLIQQSMKPFIVVGNGVIRQKAIKELHDFIHKLHAPVIHSFTAKGVLPKDSPFNYFTFGFAENDLALSGLEESDLIIVIGFDLVEKAPMDWNPTKRPILHIQSS